MINRRETHGRAVKKPQHRNIDARFSWFIFKQTSPHKGNARKSVQVLAPRAA
jgi:hypothetical protein